MQRLLILTAHGEAHDNGALSLAVLPSNEVHLPDKIHLSMHAGTRRQRLLAIVQGSTLLGGLCIWGKK